MVLRRAVPGDEDGVAQVHVESWRVAYRGLLPDDVLDGLDPAGRARRYTFAGTGADAVWTTVAVAAEHIRGFVTAGPVRDTDLDPALAGELYAVYVSPSWWGAGIGRTLIAAARHSLVEHGYTEALLWVLTGNSRAARFYRCDGWHLDGSRRQERIGAGWVSADGVVVDEVRYRRSLP